MTGSVIPSVMSVQALGKRTRDSYATSVTLEHVKLAARDGVCDFANIRSQPVVAHRASAGLARLGHELIICDLAPGSQITYVLGRFHFRKLPYLLFPQDFTMVACSS